MPNLKHDQTRFIRIPSLGIPEMRSSGTFYQTVTMERMTIRQNSSSLWLCVSSSMTVQSFIPIKWHEKKLSMKSFQIFASDHFKFKFLF